MSIQFACPKCNKQHRTAPEFAGRQARCSCGEVLVVPTLASQPQTEDPQDFPFPPPPVAPRMPPRPSPAAADPTNPATWEPEPVKYTKAATKPSPLAKLLAEQRLLVIGVGAGIGLIVLLALVVWMFFGGGGIAEARRYLPNDCLVVATANVDAVMNSSIYQQMKKDLPNVADDERHMEQEVGVAPANISRITFGVGGKLNSPSDSEMAMVVRLKKAVSAADIKSNSKQKYEETKIGNITVFEATNHGEAFCMPESTLIVTCPKLEVLKNILERGKSPEFSEGMQNAMNEANFSRTLAVAVNVKGLGSKVIDGLPVNANLSEFTENVLGLALDVSLDSSKATVNATLLCKDAKLAEDVRKMLDAAQVAMRNYAKKAPGTPSEAADTIDAVKFSVSGAKVKGYVQASLEPFSKWIKEQAGKR